MLAIGSGQRILYRLGSGLWLVPILVLRRSRFLNHSRFSLMLGLLLQFGYIWFYTAFWMICELATWLLYVQAWCN